MTHAAAQRVGDRAFLAVMGEPVVYWASYGEPTTVTAYFESPYNRVEVGEAGVQSAAPAVWVRLADLPTDPEADQRGARIERAGLVYRIAEVEKDGVGGVRLRLHRA
ncbi:MAG TPA: hypothetical protein VF406_16175 [Thermodesulfobacteriota bacterium]